jgi:hypothetical protein
MNHNESHKDKKTSINFVGNIRKLAEGVEAQLYPLHAPLNMNSLAETVLPGQGVHARMSKRSYVIRQPLWQGGKGVVKVDNSTYTTVYFYKSYILRILGKNVHTVACSLVWFVMQLQNTKLEESKKCFLVFAPYRFWYEGYSESNRQWAAGKQAIRTNFLLHTKRNAHKHNLIFNLVTTGTEALVVLGDIIVYVCAKKSAACELSHVLTPLSTPHYCLSAVIATGFSGRKIGGSR